MARQQIISGNLDAIAAERARLQTKLMRLDAREKTAQDKMRDAGRNSLLSPLAKVKLAAMSKAVARAIAHAVVKLGGSAVAKILGTPI
jgi:hypothetical protein